MGDLLFKLRVLKMLVRGAYDEWLASVWKRDLDGLYCCDGHECGCGGDTVRDMWGWHLIPRTNGGQSNG